MRKRPWHPQRTKNERGECETIAYLREGTGPGLDMREALWRCRDLNRRAGRHKLESNTHIQYSAGRARTCGGPAA